MSKSTFVQLAIFIGALLNAFGAFNNPGNNSTNLNKGI
jgi:hypothetical protein